MTRLLGFRPAFWPTFFAMIAFAILIGLGTWQMQRLGWKTALIDLVNARIAAEPVDLPQTFNLEEWNYRRVQVTGIFDHQAEQHLVWNNPAGKGGYSIFTPLRIADGRTVIINRGWVPYDRKNADSRAEGQVEASVTVMGLVRQPWPRGPFMPDNDPVKNVWFWPDISAMGAAMKLDPAPTFFIDADSAANPGGLPQGGQTVLNFRNEHLQYALTWYSLAAILLVIWFLWSRARVGAQ